MYSEKATKFLRNLHLFWLVLVPVKIRWRFRKNFVASSEYMNFMKRIQMRNHTGFGSIVSSDICKISQKSSKRFKKCLHSFMVPEVIISKLNQYQKFAFYVCSYIIKIVFQLCSAQCTVMRFDHFCLVLCNFTVHMIFKRG